MKPLLISLKSTILVAAILAAPIAVAQTNANSTEEEETRLLPERITKPRKNCRIENVDLFVNTSFSMYNKVYIYDSLKIAGVEIPLELENEIVSRVHREADSLYTLVPDMIEDLTEKVSLKTIRALANLRKTKKVLDYTTYTTSWYIKENPEMIENPKN